MCTFRFFSRCVQAVSWAKRAQKREEGDLSPQLRAQLITDQDQASDEMDVSLLQAPAHDCIGLEADKWARTLATLRNHRQLNKKAINTGYFLMWFSWRRLLLSLSLARFVFPARLGMAKKQKKIYFLACHLGNDFGSPLKVLEPFLPQSWGLGNHFCCKL